MIVNSTLIVQMIHFIIIYYVIDHLFLRFVYQEIFNERKRQDTLMNAIEDQRSQVAEQYTLKEQEWDVLRNTFADKRPELRKPTYCDIAMDEGIELTEEINEQKKHTIIKQLKSWLIEKVKYVE